MVNNVYYEKLKVVIDTILSALEDRKVTVAEIWVFLLVLGDAVKQVILESSELNDADLVELKEAANLLYDEYILPLDIPGPDWVTDPLLRNTILPGVVEGAYALVRKHKNNDSINMDLI